MRGLAKLSTVLMLCVVVMSPAACTKTAKKEETSASKAAPVTELKIGTTQEFETMNPLIMNMAASTYIFAMIGRPLLVIDAKWNWNCELCETIPTIENKLAEFKTVKGQKKIVATWKLKEGLKWGDGKPITAKDFKLSWEIGNSPKVQVGSREFYERVEAFDIVDDRTFKTTFKEARYDYYQLPMYPLPSHLEGPVWSKTKNQTNGYDKQSVYVRQPTTAGLYYGPYIIKELKLGSHVVVETNPHFYGRKATIPRIVIKLIPNTQTLEASLLSGTIDMIGELGMSFDQAVAFDKRVQKNPSLKGKYVTHFRDGLVYEHIDLNLRNPILKDQNVRKALVYAIDRDKLTQALFDGRQKKAISNIHPLDPYYSDDVVKYPYDPAKAAALLDAAGWKLGKDGIRTKKGKKLELTLMTTAGNKTRELVEVFLQEEWKKTGVKINIKNEPARVYFGETVRKAKYTGMAMYAWISSPDSPPRGTLHSSEIPTQKNAWSGQNSGGWSDKNVDAMLEQVFREFEFEKRKEIMQKIQYAYTDQVPVIPLYLRAQIATVPGGMRGFQLSGHQFYSPFNVEDWTFSANVSKSSH